MLGYQTYMPDQHWVEAHNDYLQLAAEGGLLLGLPIVITIFFFVREVRRRFHESSDDTRTYWLRAGAVAGLIAIAFQEVVDFSL
jgi:O-antigen ligase